MRAGEGGLIVLVDPEIRMRDGCDRIAREIEMMAEDPQETSEVVVAPLDEKQAGLIKARLTPTFFASYSFKFEEYLGQMDYYHRLVVRINRSKVVA